MFHHYFPAYVPRNRTDRTERNALSVAEPSNNTSLSNLNRSASLRTERLRKDDDGTTSTTSIELRRDRDSEKGNVGFVTLLIILKWPQLVTK